MKRVWQFVGRVVYWVAWPGLYILLKGSHRSRVLLVCNDRVLLVKTWLGSGRWGLPGGGIEKNESAVDGAVREVSEEVGITLSKNDLVYLYEKGYQSKNNFQFNYTAFAVELSHEPKIQLDPEIIEARWVDIETAQSSDASQVVHDALAAWGGQTRKV